MVLPTTWPLVNFKSTKTLSVYTYSCIEHMALDVCTGVLRWKQFSWPWIMHGQMCFLMHDGNILNCGADDRRYIQDRVRAFGHRWTLQRRQCTYNITSIYVVIVTTGVIQGHTWRLHQKWWRNDTDWGNVTDRRRYHSVAIRVTIYQCGSVTMVRKRLSR